MRGQLRMLIHGALTGRPVSGLGEYLGRARFSFHLRCWIRAMAVSLLALQPTARKPMMSRAAIWAWMAARGRYALLAVSPGMLRHIAGRHGMTEYRRFKGRRRAFTCAPYSHSPSRARFNGQCSSLSDAYVAGRYRHILYHEDDAIFMIIWLFITMLISHIDIIREDRAWREDIFLRFDVSEYAIISFHWDAEMGAFAMTLAAWYTRWWSARFRASYFLSRYIKSPPLRALLSAPSMELATRLAGSSPSYFAQPPATGARFSAAYSAKARRLACSTKQHSLADAASRALPLAFRRDWRWASMPCCQALAAKLLYALPAGLS